MKLLISVVSTLSFLLLSSVVVAKKDLSSTIPTQPQNSSQPSQPSAKAQLTESDSTRPSTEPQVPTSPDQLPGQLKYFMPIFNFSL
jgi:hypothetical protein